ncbi:polysaccharide lyase family 7 protein [Agarivorans sp. TSD2052]|uniref:polysaccharide lyase family 7 protein n=1 Tax=Agarivorans sp. TSD2052 TaxID=2937286 RepID=UPI0035321BAA
MLTPTFSAVIGQIHGSKNEPLKIYYRKMPNHDKGSIFWNYKINPAQKNAMIFRTMSGVTSLSLKKMTLLKME